PASAQIRIVDDVVVNKCRRVDELHDGRVQRAAIAAVAREPRCHQKDGRTNPFAATRSNVLTDLGDERDVRLEMPLEFAFDLLEVSAGGLGDLGEIRRRFFHSGSGRTLSRRQQDTKAVPGSSRSRYGWNSAAKFADTRMATSPAST